MANHDQNEVRLASRNPAIYVRVSKYDPRERTYSPEMQLETCRQRLNRGKKSEPVVYQDLDLSGKDDQRPQYQRLLRDIRGGKVSVVAAYDQSRLSRNVADFYTFLDVCNQNKTRLLMGEAEIDTVTPEGKMWLGMMAVFAQAEREKIARRIADGFQEKASKGGMLGQAPIGYLRQLKCSAPDCEWQGQGASQCPLCGTRTLREEITIVDDEAEIVRSIFSLYTQGSASMVGLARLAVKLGWHSRRGKLMTNNSIRTILTNLHYTGLTVMDDRPPEERHSGMHKHREKRRRVAKDERIKGNWPAIIPLSTWDQAQAVTERQRLSKRASKSENKTYPLTPLLICDVCGKRLNGERKPTGPIYRCMTSRRGGTCDQTRAILTADLEQEFRDKLFRYVDLPAEGRPETRTPPEDFKSNLAYAEKRHAIRLKNLIDLREEDQLDKNEYYARKAEADAALEEARLAATAPGPSVIAEFRTLAEAWDLAEPNDQKSLAASVFNQIWVRDGHIVKWEPRPGWFAFLKERTDLWKGAWINVGPVGFEPTTGGL